MNTEGKSKILKDEMKHHGRVDESSSEQQFRKSDVITVKNLDPYS